MVIVDSTVWIDFLKGRGTEHVTKLEELLAEEVDIFTTGLIVQEVLTGIKDKKERGKLRKEFEHFILIDPSLETHVEAAEIFDGCRKKGYTVRSVIDCLISSLALEYDLTILENDKDYSYISRVYPLKTYRKS
jgi:predicted nucleic acid-binding protein